MRNENFMSDSDIKKIVIWLKTETDIPEAEIDSLPLKQGIPFGDAGSLIWNVIPKYVLDRDEQLFKLEQFTRELNMLLPIEEITPENAGILKAAGIMTAGDLVEKNPLDVFSLADFEPGNLILTLHTYSLDFSDMKRTEAMKKYEEKARILISDGLIDSSDADELSLLANELGLTSAETSYLLCSVSASYSEENPGKDFPVVYRLVTDEDASAFVSACQDNYEETLETNHGVKSSPDVVQKKLAEILFGILDLADYSLYADLHNFKFLIRDEQLHEEDEVTIPDLFTKALTIASELSTHTGAEESFIHDVSVPEAEQMFSDYCIPGSYFLPVDVSYSVLIPEDIRAKFADIRNLGQDVLDVISDVFLTESELIDNSMKIVDKGLEINLKLRHLFSVEDGTDYSNIQYENIGNKLGQECGFALNRFFENLSGESFDVPKILFREELSASRPVLFHDERGRRIEVDDAAIEKYSMTPEEFAKELSPSMCRFAGTSVFEEVQRFRQEQVVFKDFLKEHPYIKEYADKYMKTLAERQEKGKKKVRNSGLPERGQGR